MDEDQRDCLQRLFAAATDRAETAHEAAIAGQSGDRSAREYADAARILRSAAQDIAALAEAALVIAGPCDEDPNHPGNLAE